MSEQNESTKEEHNQEQSNYITVTVHHPDGTEESHELSYFVGCGIPRDMKSDEEVTPTIAMQIGRSNIKEQLAVNKVLSKQVDPFLLMMEGLIGSTTVISGDKTAEEEE